MQANTSMSYVCQGLAGVVNYLLSKRFGHPLVIIVNLREDLVVECNGVSYSPRESDTLTVPINMPGIPAYEIEVRDAILYLCNFFDK